MIGLGSKTYYSTDGTVDWLRIIARTVYSYEQIQYGESTIFIESIAAKRAIRLYYKKTDIRTLYKNSEVK